MSPGPGTVVTDVKRARTGMAFIHAAVDDHSRLAYAEILGEKKATRKPPGAAKDNQARNQHSGTTYGVRRIARAWSPGAQRSPRNTRPHRGDSRDATHLFPIRFPR